MSTPRENKDQHVRRMATAICSRGDRPIPVDGPCSECVNVAYRAYDAGARIPDPSAPSAPEVVVSEEAYNAAMMAWRGEGGIHSVIRAAFPHLLAANPWVIDAAIRERVAKLPGKYLDIYGRHRITIGSAEVARDYLLASLGVAP